MNEQTNQTGQLFHCLKYRDPGAAIRFLTALGFREVAVYRDDSPDQRVAHAEFAWPGGGGVMFGDAELGAEDLCATIGNAACYCAVPTEADVDRIHELALAAGGTSVREPATPEYGGRECSVLDHEGNSWSFGVYSAG